MADWLRCADVVVGKAGPGTIAEATCCGAPLVLTSFVPGQEKGNAEFVTGAGAGVYAPRPRQLVAEIGRLRGDPDALAAMRERVGAGRAAPARPPTSPASSPTSSARPAATAGRPARGRAVPCCATLVADAPPGELLTFFLSPTRPTHTSGAPGCVWRHKPLNAQTLRKPGVLARGWRRGTLGCLQRGRHRIG